MSSKRTATRRDSSLISTSRRYTGHPNDNYSEMASTARGHSTAHLNSESGLSLAQRPKGSVRKEVITLLFESMLDSIVDSWQVISRQEDVFTGPIEKTLSEVTVTSKKKKIVGTKGSKTKSAKSRSKMDLADSNQSDPMQIVWWSAPDEKAVIHFKNGNIYEGNISMKSMNGDGRFQWADGTVYLGEFKDNEMKGKGIIHWKDDTWYEGDFSGNLRHGKGLYVDSREQRSYTGGWHCGTKHGKGAIYYSKTFKNSYDGDWVSNVRHGYGIREYCSLSGYEGGWDRYVREGRGIMIWPNHDFYKGDWRNGIMSGYGIYIWDAYYNNSMSLPSLNAYRGQWVKGKRSGYGVLNLGLGLGSHYKGEFRDNKKNGVGKFVTNNGLILQDKQLFIDDNLGSLKSDENNESGNAQEPYEFNICDSTVGLRYHVDQAINSLDKQAQVRANMICEFVENNKYYDSDLNTTICNVIDHISEGVTEDLVEFETTALRKACKCYETQLKDIYYKYATICNIEQINFTPVLIRLYLWQFYTDCDIHDKGLTLVEIDQLFCKNPDWLARSPHSPFEKIYFWQFLNSLLTIANRLYAKKTLPGPRPDTILASAFRFFMETDVLPNVGRCKGCLTQSFGSYVPLKVLYHMYKVLGERHSVRRFLCAARRGPHLYLDAPQPALVEAADDKLPVGHNIYVFADEMTFIPDDPACRYEDFEEPKNLQLFNFGNLSSKTIIKIFSNIFPQLLNNDNIMDLDIKLSFLEFFQAFIACTQESIHVKEEELRWREVLADVEPAPASVARSISHRNKV